MQLGEGVSQLQQEEQEGQPMPCLASGGNSVLPLAYIQQGSPTFISAQAKIYIGLLRGACPNSRSKMTCLCFPKPKHCFSSKLHLTYQQRAETSGPLLSGPSVPILIVRVQLLPLATVLNGICPQDS